jgi:outer membrane autotransporter barrel domain
VADQARSLSLNTASPDGGYETASGQGYASLPPDRTSRGIRLWGGYLGSIERTDSHGGYHGYRQHVNGFVTGAARDFASGSLGGYFGYTGATLRMRDGANGRVGTDGYQVGLLGSLTPCAVPGLALSADAGFGIFDNDSRRFDGVGNLTGDFKQRLWTGGLGASYDYGLGRARLTPFATARYTHLDQDGFNEYGGTTAARIDDARGDSFQTELGLRLSGDYRFSCNRGKITPYGSASWRHEFGDRYVSSSAAFAGAAAQSFALRSVARDRDSLGAAVGIGYRRDIAGSRWLGTNLGYDVSVGANGLAHSVAAKVEFGF